MSEPPARFDLLQKLRSIPDAHERIMWLTEHGRRTKPLAVHERVPANRVPGCKSAVWLVDDSRDGRCFFRGEAEAAVLRGLVMLICDHTNARFAADVAVDTTDIVATLELERHLSPTRTLGLRALQAHVRMRASIHAAPHSP